jgi:molecular chaperone IbpA
MRSPNVDQPMLFLICCHLLALGNSVFALSLISPMNSTPGPSGIGASGQEGLLKRRAPFLTLSARARAFVPHRAPVHGARLSGAGHGVQGARIHVALKEDMAMTTFNVAPLWRSTIGFDRMIDLIEDSVRWTGNDNHPPYNVERLGEDHYQVSLALAGFRPDDIGITVEQNLLTVEGRKAEGEHQYLYQGISSRPFRRTFNLADYVQVKGAAFGDGMLKIDLVREVPEAMKPRRIAIQAGNDNRQVEHKHAA